MPFSTPVTARRASTDHPVSRRGHPPDVPTCPPGTGCPHDVCGTSVPQMRLAPDDKVTRSTFDAVAEEYAKLMAESVTDEPLDRAVLAAFIELVKSTGGGPVADVGCGTGRLTAQLADADLNTLGLDLSEGMVRVGHTARPDLSFGVAHAAALPLRSGAVGAVLAWYSIINTRPDLIPTVLDEFWRVLRPGGPLVLAFQCGQGERVDRETAYGHVLPITYFRHRIEDVMDYALAAGFRIYATVQRNPALPHETTPQGFILALRGDG